MLAALYELPVRVRLPGSVANASWHPAVRHGPRRKEIPSFLQVVLGSWRIEVINIDHQRVNIHGCPAPP